MRAPKAEKHIPELGRIVIRGRRKICNCAALIAQLGIVSVPEAARFAILLPAPAGPEKYDNASDGWRTGRNASSDQPGAPFSRGPSRDFSSGFRAQNRFYKTVHRHIFGKKLIQHRP